MNFKPIIRKTILTCLMSVVSYHLSIIIIIFYPKSNGLNNIPIEAKNIVHANDKHPNDSVLSCNIKITLYCNTRTKIYLYPNISSFNCFYYFLSKEQWIKEYSNWSQKYSPCNQQTSTWFCSIMQYKNNTIL